MEASRAIAELISSDRELEVVALTADGNSAIAAAKQYEPDIVLLDLLLPDVDSVRVTEVLAAEVPSAAVIMMSEQQNLNELRNAMKAGARDLLIKPLETKDLIASIQSVFTAELQRQSRLAARTGPDGAPTPRATRGKILTVFSPKGGTGRTTTAVNLAISLRQLTGKRVAVVDCNLMFGDVGIVMNILAK